jgi:hypothetical protein
VHLNRGETAPLCLTLTPPRCCQSPRHRPVPHHPPSQGPPGRRPCVGGRGPLPPATRQGTARCSIILLARVRLDAAPVLPVVDLFLRHLPASHHPPFRQGRLLQSATGGQSTKREGGTEAELGTYRCLTILLTAGVGRRGARGSWSVTGGWRAGPDGE